MDLLPTLAQQGGSALPDGRDCDTVRRYEEAARLRDELKTVQEEADDASSRAELTSRKLKEQRQLRLGQRVTHRKLGYRAAVCGCVDPRSFWLSRKVVVTLEQLLSVRGLWLLSLASLRSA